MTRRTVGIASLIWGVSILLSRLIGLIRESVIGRTIGGGTEADAYWTAFVLPDFLNYLLAGGVLSIVFIPMFSGYLARDDEEGGWRAFSSIANTLTLLIVGLTAILWFLVPSITPIIAPGIQGADRLLLNELIRIILPAQIFHLVGGLLSATLQARDKHTLPALAPLVYTMGIIAGGLILGPSIGAKGFAWGVLAGSILGPFLLPLIGAIRSGLSWQLRVEIRHPDLGRYFLLSLPVMLGFSIIVLDDMLQKHFGSTVSEGVISRLQYAKTLMKVPMGVFGLAIGVASYPTLSRMFARNEKSQAYGLISDALCTMFVLAFVAQAALTVAGAEIAEVIWGVSRFNAAAISEIGQLTGLLSLGLWAWSGQLLVARGFYAHGNTWTPTIIGSVMAAIAYPVYSWCAHTYGAHGLAYASAASVSVYFLVLLATLTHKLTGSFRAVRAIFNVLIRMALAAVGSIWVCTHLAHQLTHWPVFWRGLVLGLASILLTTALAHGLGVPEVRNGLRRMSRRLARS